MSSYSIPNKTGIRIKTAKSDTSDAKREKKKRQEEAEEKQKEFRENLGE
jgi:hypothetical protein